MTRKQIAEMIKKIHKKALEEVIGKSPPFKPEHITPRHQGVNTQGQEKSSPNEYLHRMSEEVLNELGGTYHKRKLNVFYQKKIASKRRKWQLDGQQSMKRGARYTEEEVQKLGDTETGEKTKSRQDDVDINPNIPVARGGETSKNNNTTVKETKEK